SRYGMKKAGSLATVSWAGEQDAPMAKEHAAMSTGCRNRVVLIKQPHCSEHFCMTQGWNAREARTVEDLPKRRSRNVRTISRLLPSGKERGLLHFSQISRQAGLFSVGRGFVDDALLGCLIKCGGHVTVSRARFRFFARSGHRQKAALQSFEPAFAAVVGEVLPGAAAHPA